MSFSDVVGQTIAINSFKKCIKEDKIPHGFLFEGHDGVGKSLCAKNFAKVLNCLQNTEDCCDRCVSCIKIDSFNHPDVFWIKPENVSSIKIEQIRYLQSQINLKRYESKYKIFIIQDAHSISEEASNCLLKTLEEPPEFRIIILVTNYPEKLLATIRSRLQMIKFFRLDEKFICDILVNEYKLDEKEAKFISRFSEGSLGRATSFCQDNLWQLRNNLFAIVLSNSQNFYELGQELSGSNKEDILLRLQIIMSFYRDILQIKCGNLSHLVNLDFDKELVSFSNLYNLSQIYNNLETIRKTVDSILSNANKKLAIDSLIVSLTYPLRGE